MNFWQGFFFSIFLCCHADCNEESLLIALNLKAIIR